VKWLLLSLYAASAISAMLNIPVWYRVWQEKTSRLALMLMMSNIGLASLSVFYGLGALDRAVFGSQFQIGEFTASDPGRVAFWVVMAGLSAIQFGMAQGWFSRQ